MLMGLEFRPAHPARSCSAEMISSSSKQFRHASITMTGKYAHLAPDHLHQAVENVGFTAQCRSGGFKNGAKPGDYGAPERI